ncbi:MULTISPECIES: lmo0937 family membrane protein [Arenibacter]
MSRILFLIAVIMLVIWAIGLFVLHIGMLIHFFLLLAVLAMIIKVVRDK